MTTLELFVKYVKIDSTDWEKQIHDKALGMAQCQSLQPRGTEPRFQARKHVCSNLGRKQILHSFLWRNNTVCLTFFFGFSLSTNTSMPSKKWGEYKERQENKSKYTDLKKSHYVCQNGRVPLTNCLFLKETEIRYIRSFSPCTEQQLIRLFCI